MAESAKRQDPLHDKHGRASEQGDCEQALSPVCRDDGDDEPCQRGAGARGGVQDRRKGHVGEAGMGYVIKKT